MCIRDRDNAYKIYKKENKEEFKYWFDTFTYKGRTPNYGELWKLPYHAETLESIGKTHAVSYTHL